VLCPGMNNRDNVVRSGLYRLPRSSVEFHVQAWSFHFNITYFPPSLRTWIALRGAPLQTWSRAEIVRLVQEFGYPVRISPYALPTGEFREIRLTLEGEHPRDIAKQILFRKGQYATFIEVYIHDWMKIANGPPPSPQGGQGFNTGTHQAGGMGQHQEAQQHQARRSSGSSNVTPSDNLFPSVLQRRAGRGDTVTEGLIKAK
jgi:hypothetical protein